MSQEANKEILRLLTNFLEDYPDNRFGQALVNLNIVQPIDDSTYTLGVKDPFYDRPEDMLERVRKTLDRSWR